MENNNIEKCIVLYNPISSSFKKENIDLINNTLKKHGLNMELCESKYQGNIIEQIKKTDDDNTLLLTLGGDGTVKEAYTAYNEINQRGFYSHIPTGTTNDMKKNYDVMKKNPDKILEDILNGEVILYDSFKVNGEVSAYTSVFGFLAHIPYVTNSKLKKMLGHGSYVITALKDIIKKPILYNIDYEIDGKTYNENCIIGAVSNSKGFAGIDLYKDASLSDGKLEYLFLKDISPSLVCKLFNSYLKNDINLANYSDIITIGKTDNLKIKFKDNYPTYPIDIDGEKSNIILSKENNELNFELGKQIKVLKAKNTNK